MDCHRISHASPSSLSISFQGGQKPSCCACLIRQDFICNEVGNRWWVEALEWERAADWNAAPREDWEVDGEKAGTAQVAEPLTFVTVDNAGHMVRL